ncbi:MAG: DUF488 domain-containing protein [Candidatus Zixiibacteriota bacterium]
MAKEVYAVGSSHRRIEEFCCLLVRFNIQALVDVRRFPVMKFAHFKKSDLALYIQQPGMEYFYLGDILGGFREKGYQEHAKTTEFLEGARRLEGIASKAVTVFMRGEKFPYRCHRRFMARRTGPR